MPRRRWRHGGELDEHIDDRQHVQGDDKANKGIDDAHKLRRHELGDVLGHWGVPFGIITVRSSLPRGLFIWDYGCKRGRSGHKHLNL